MLSGIGAAAFVTPAYAQTLDSAVAQALATHPGVEAARAALEVSGEQENEAFSRYFPQVSLNSAFGRMYGDNSTSRGLSVTRGSGYSYLGEGSVTVSQLLFDGMETPSRVDAAEARRKSAGADVLDVREILALRAVQSYLDVLRTARALALIDAQAVAVGDYADRIAGMVDDGASDETELQQARDVKVILQGIRAEYKGQFLAASARYAEVIGAAPPEALNDPPARDAAVPADMAQAIALALAEHPAIAALRLQGEAASYDVDAEKGTLYPDFNGEFSYLKSDKEDVIGGEVEDARALVRMSWNFSTGGEQFARIRRSKFAHKESLARTEEMKRQIEQGVKLAYSEYNTAQDQLTLLEERRQLNEKLFSAYEAQFEGARVNLLKLMQADNQLFNTKLESLNGRYRSMGAQYAILASMGQLQKTLGAPAPVTQAAAGQGHEQR